MKNEHILETDIAYRVIIHYNDKGKRKTISKCFNFEKYGSKAEALKKAKSYRDIIKFKANQRTIEDRTKTLKDIIELLDELTVRSAETKKKHDGLIANHITKYIDLATPFKDIDKAMIQRSVNSAKKKSADSISRLVGIWQKLYKVAIKSEVVYTDLTQTIDIPRSQKIVTKREQYFDINRFARLLDDIDRSPDGHTIALALRLMAYTGIRPNECYAIERKNVDQSNRSILINQSLGSSEFQHNVIKPTKTSESVRYVYYPVEFDDDIKELCKNRLIFTRENGKPLTSSYVDYFIKRYSSVEFRPYMLRHYVATELIKSGQVSLKAVQNVLGHKSETMTLNYSRSIEKERKNALENLWSINGGSVSGSIS